MTKDELYERFNEGQVIWHSKYSMEIWIDLLNEFFESNVCIPKGENRHPSSDVLHQAIEGVKIQGWNHIRDEWEDDTSWFIDKNDLDYPTKYRIKPSEPIYEYQWYSVVNGIATMPCKFYTEDEIDTVTFVKIKETKRERK